MPVKAETNADRLVALAYGFRSAKALISAVELGVFSALAERSLTGDELSAELGLHQRGAKDFLDALVALQLLERDHDGRYANAPEADRYLDRRKPDDYIGGLFEHLNEREYPHWMMLSTALRTGEPHSGARSISKDSFFEDQSALAAFAKGMTGGSLPAARALADTFGWRDYGSVVDIGTAEGCVPIQLALRHSHLTGIGFDRSSMGPLFKRCVLDHGLSDRLRFIPGNFFIDPLPTADVMVMGRVLHNWNLETKRMLLAKAHAALPAGGALIVYERLIDDGRRTHASALLSSLNMLLMTPGGFEFTAADCMGWMRDAGFDNCRAEPLTSDISMVIGFT